jgi:hypothetical protein
MVLIILSSLAFSSACLQFPQTTNFFSRRLIQIWDSKFLLLNPRQLRLRPRLFTLGTAFPRNLCWWDPCTTEPDLPLCSSTLPKVLWPRHRVTSMNGEVGGPNAGCRFQCGQGFASCIPGGCMDCTLVFLLFLVPTLLPSALCQFPMLW